MDDEAMNGRPIDEERVSIAALAGLLYGVAAFAQRAGWRSDEQGRVSAGLVGEFVPAQWHEGLYRLLGWPDDRTAPGPEAQIVVLADQLAAGEHTERDPTTETADRPGQLLSIFCRLEADGKTAPEPLYLPLKTLALDRSTLFPAPAIPKAALERDYVDLWQGFADGWRALRGAHTPSGNLAAYLEGLLLLLQRYAWCIPYARSAPDVSLYDHSRVVAALAACLIDRREFAPACMSRTPQQDGEPMAWLVGGDISGVQDFIYTISSQGATPGLRGRSFYLQLLTEVVACYVLRRTGLPAANLIYQGGGAFYLLVSAELRDGSRLRDIQAEISQVLLAHHRGDLYLALAGVPLAPADFYDGRVSGKWEELSRALREVKQRRFAELGEEMVALFIPQGHGGNQDKQCQVCGQEHPATQSTKKQPGDDNETGTYKCPQCLAYEGLGDALRQADYLWLAVQRSHIPDNPLESLPGEWRDVLAAFGYRVGVASDLHQIPDVSSRRILALKDKALVGLRPDTGTTVGRRFLVNVTPTYERVDADWLSRSSVEIQRRVGEDLPGYFGVAVKPFSLLEAQSEGIERLGVLRMDLDNGAQLFSDGFVERDMGGHVTRRFSTLSRVAALSFAISLYFEGWVERIAEEMNAETRAARGDTLYSIYSGGDDLFFVGAWDRVVELARKIRADLTPFAAHHPGVHTSAGVVLVGGKYPLAQAAQDAGEAERKAKVLKWKDAEGSRHEKDALHFLGQSMSWVRIGLEDCLDAPQSTVHGMTHALANWVNAEHGLKSLLRLLINVQEQHDTAAQKRRERGDELNRGGEEQTLYGPWLWRGYYNLKRMARRYKEQSELRETILKLAEQLRSQGFRDVEWIGLAARWAELLTRG